MLKFLKLADRAREQYVFHAAVVIRALCAIRPLHKTLIRKGKVLRLLVGFCSSATHMIQALGISGLRDVLDDDDKDNSLSHHTHTQNTANTQKQARVQRHQLISNITHL